jgi:hypothetical protein
MAYLIRRRSAHIAVGLYDPTSQPAPADRAEASGK